MAIGKLKTWLGRRRHTASGVANISGEDADRFIGPSPNPKTNLVVADLALRGSSMLAWRAAERALLGRRYAPDKARKILKGRSVSETLVGTALARLATRSVPGAIVIGGGLLAKTLYDRRRGNQAKREGEIAIEKMAAKGTREKD